MDVKYEPGTIKVVAYDDDGNAIAEKETHTAGKPHRLELSANRSIMKGDGKDLSYITVSVVDNAGNLCPNADNQLSFEVKGAGQFKLVCNGDATSLELFHLPAMKAFSGKLVVTVEASDQEGKLHLEVSSEGLEPAELTIDVKQVIN